MYHLKFFQFWHFQPIFVVLKLTCLVTLFDRNLQVFKNSPKLTNFGIFKELLSTHNVNVALLAILNETFSVIFKHFGCATILLLHHLLASSAATRDVHPLSLCYRVVQEKNIAFLRFP